MSVCIWPIDRAEAEPVADKSESTLYGVDKCAQPLFYLLLRYDVNFSMLSRLQSSLRFSPD